VGLSLTVICLALSSVCEAQGVASAASLWPKVSGVATVYYQINGLSGDVTNIDAAVSTFNGDFPGVIQWVEGTGSGTYVDINLNSNDFSGECEVTSEGYPSAPNTIISMGGSGSCTVTTILHEMGHIVGLYHQQTRTDSATYVTVNYSNAIKSTWPYDFAINTQNQQLLTPYDYASVMQYPSYSLSRNGGPVIETIPAGIPLQGTDGVPGAGNQDYSAGDKEAIDRLYGAAPTMVTVTSNPVGLQVIVDGSTVTTPQTYSWALNSTHTLNVSSNVQQLTGDIENSTTSATFYYTYGRWNDSATQSHTIAVTPGNGSPAFPSNAPQISTYSANFIQLVPYTAAIYPTGSGSVSPSPMPQTYSGVTGNFFVARQTVTLTASANAGYSFYEFNNAPFWLPGGLGANPKEFYVPDTGNPVATTVEFSNTPVYSFNVNPADTISSAFSSNLWGYIDSDFWYMPKNFSTSYDGTGWNASTSHTVNVNSGTPEYPYSSDSRFSFLSWSDAGAESHTIASLPGVSTTYTATVTPQYAPATNFSFFPCGGTAAITPTSPTHDGFFPWGTSLTYTASTGTNWTFGGWTYDLTGTTTPTNLTADDETLVYANFNTTNSPLKLTSLSPTSVPAGSPAFTLTLNGTGFTPSSVVSVNGNSPTVTYVSPIQLTVQVNAAWVSSPTNFDVYVENYPSGSTCANFGYYTFTVTGFVPAVMSTPPPSSTLTSASTTFNWTAGVGASAYYLWIGTTPGGYDLANQGPFSGTTATVTLPTNGAAIYVRLWTFINGGTTQLYNDYTYTETGAAVMTSPANESTLTSASTTFNWSTAPGSSAYYLWVGTAPGTANLANIGPLSGTTATVNLPTNGTTIYVRLWTFFNGGATQFHNDYTYTEFAPAAAAITSPTDGSTLSASTTFNWSAGSGGTVTYYLWVGTSPGTANLVNIGPLSGTSATVSLPTNGVPVYVRLWTFINGGVTQLSNDYNYTEASVVAGVITSPTNDSTLQSASTTFNWSAGSGGTITSYLWIGTSLGSANLVNMGPISGTSATVTLPTSGVPVYVRLWTFINGGATQLSNDYTYTEASVSAGVITSPTNGSTLATGPTTFNWSAGSGGTITYYLWIGTSSGTANLVNMGPISGTSATVNLPTNGTPIYVRLWTFINGGTTQLYNDYSYTEFVYAAVITSPSPGTTLSSASTTFTWIVDPDE